MKLPAAQSLLTPSLIIVLGGGFPWQHANAQAVAPPVQCGFEEPDYRLGSIDGQRGWSVQQGRAEVVADAAHSGQRALKLFPADPFSQAKLTLAPSVPPAPVMFLDFYVIPAASEAAQQEEFLDVDGARIGLFTDPARPGQGVVHVFHGDGAGGGQWLATAVTLPLAENSARSRGWVRLSLREDFARQTWDLWVDGRAAAADLGFQDADVGHTQNYIIMGDAAESVLLDDLSIAERHPLGPDADGDGMVDSIERQLGLNHLFDDRDADADGDGVRNLDEAVAAAAPAGETPALVRAAPSRPAAPSVSPASGYLAAPATVTVSGTPERGRIRYTLDGSDPRRAAGPLTFTAAVPITTTTVLRAVAVDARGRMSEPVTAAWVFPDQVAAQSRPAGVPEVFLDRGFNGGAEVAQRIPFGMQPGEGIAASLAAAPVVILSAGPQALFDAGSGLYARSSQKTTAAAAVICFDASAQRPATQSQAVLSISGESSRYHDITAKHSLRLRFAGDDSIAGVLTGTGESARQIVLRHPTHDSWTVSGPWAANRQEAKYFADRFAARWLGDAGHFTLRRQWVHVFLDASYWGVYEAIEQQSQDPAGVTDLLEGGPGQQVAAVFGATSSWRAARQRLLDLASLAASGPVSDADWTAAAATTPPATPTTTTGG